MIIKSNKAIEAARRLLSASALAVLTLQLSACVHRPPAPDAAEPVPVVSTTDECRARLALTDLGIGEELDAQRISVINWNVHKTRDENWLQTMASYADDADLVLFQEASLREDTIADLDSSKFWSFVPGYRKHGEVTGVMTLSTIKPLTQCGFVHAEPLLRTPKATNVTRFALTGTDETLLVVNVHAVNFSLGLGAFEAQFQQIRSLISEHRGPVILSGDLNTWRSKRVRLIDEMAKSLELTAVVFADDHRVTAFGHPLDHIYVRGLYALNASTQQVDTSDHNPMSAVFSM